MIDLNPLAVPETIDLKSNMDYRSSFLKMALPVHPEKIRT